MYVSKRTAVFHFRLFFTTIEGGDSTNMHDDTTQSPTIYCSQCGRQVPDKRFCMFCGAPLIKSGPATQDRFDLTAEQTVEQNSSRRQPITDLPEGTRIGDYTIVSRIGYGGFGTVYAAYHQYTDDRIALKLIPVTSQSIVDAVKNEFSVRRKITDFSHVVRAWQPSTVTYQGNDFLAYPMELMASNLSSMIRRVVSERPYRWSRTVTTDIFPQICAGVAQCHQHGILHLDIKPSNVLLDSHGVPKMTDFGISAIARGSASPSSAGTLGYAAPEQLQGGQVDERTDVYALGVLLLELTTGSRESSAHESLAAYHPHLAEVIDRCTRHIPSKRFQSVDELRAALKTPREMQIEEKPSSNASTTTVRVYKPTLQFGARARQKNGLSVPISQHVEEWIAFTDKDVHHYYKYARIRSFTDLYDSRGEKIKHEIQMGRLVSGGLTITSHRRIDIWFTMACLSILTVVSGAHTLVDFFWTPLAVIYTFLVSLCLLIVIPIAEAADNRRFAVKLFRVEIRTTTGMIGPVLIHPHDIERIKQTIAGINT